jgi:hypothetical protein
MDDLELVIGEGGDQSLSGEALVERPRSGAPHLSAKPSR